MNFKSLLNMLKSRPDLRVFFVDELFQEAASSPIFGFQSVNKLKSYFLRFLYLVSAIILWYLITILLCPFIREFDILRWTSLTFYDSFSLLLSILTATLTPICMYIGKRYKNAGLYSFLLLLMEVFLIICFLTHNILLFYVSFEVVTAIMFIIIIYWGYESRRNLASFYFFYFTFFSSLFFLLAIAFVLYNYSSSSWYDLSILELPPLVQSFVWWCFLFAFAVKVPMFPFHIWLPEAHVEAPTGGSIMLAAVLLKLGFYGLYRFLIPIVPVISHYYGIFICMIGLLSVTHAMMAATRQADAKRIVAYCSIAHMNVGIMALFTFTSEGILGSCYGMLAHGIVSAALFFLIGVLYSRYGTRNIEYYGGAFHYMPLFSFFFFVFTLGNISFPMTMNFIAEFMMVMSISTYSKALLIFLVFGFTLNVFVALYLFVRISYGVWKTPYATYFIDLTRFEYFSLFFLTILLFFGGIFPYKILLSMSETLCTGWLNGLSSFSISDWNFFVLAENAKNLSFNKVTLGYSRTTMAIPNMLLDVHVFENTSSWFTAAAATFNTGLLYWLLFDQDLLTMSTFSKLPAFPFVTDYALNSFCNKAYALESIRFEINQIAKECATIDDIAVLQKKANFAQTKIQDMLKVSTILNDLVPSMARTPADKEHLYHYFNLNSKQAFEDLSAINERLTELKALGFLVLVPTVVVDTDEDDTNPKPWWQKAAKKFFASVLEASTDWDEIGFIDQIWDEPDDDDDSALEGTWVFFSTRGIFAALRDGYNNIVLPAHNRCYARVFFNRDFPIYTWNTPFNISSKLEKSLRITTNLPTVSTRPYLPSRIYNIANGLKWSSYYRNYLDDLKWWNSARRTIFWYSTHYDCHALIATYFDPAIKILNRDLLTNKDLIAFLKTEQIRLSHNQNIDKSTLMCIKSILNLPDDNIVSLVISEGWPSTPSLNSTRFYNFLACRSSTLPKNTLSTHHILRDPTGVINSFKLLWK